MWTSTYLGQQGSGWCQWCLSEEFDCDRDKAEFPLWTLETDPAARVLEIASYADLESVCKTYPHRRDWEWRGNRHYDLYPDWKRIAEDFDAVHMTDDGQWATRLTHPLNLYGWDCESTLWFRWAFTGATDLGTVRVEPVDAWWEETADAA